ncbi:hypothetical protein C8D77_111154 [Mesorhizobium loti]|uniref:Uncharacterized protein n=1 Tax=Rhizobium loti TaxID=381 RepID=A0A8E2W8N6_RHILI|nr:hypothetical protein [Mesorhizobium loti]PWJ88431.1 hypothetical protein C8D77_111154 [Mesorhizobium loti]
MSDSFFTTRTAADMQFEQVNIATCELFMDAAVRRIAKVEGPFEAAKRLQRLADICSGAYVLPIEHWAQLGKVEQQKVEAPPRVSTRKRIFDFIGSPTAAWLAGLATGFLMGSS